MRSKESVVEVSTGPPNIKGRYERFNTKLGQGAFKTVWKAFDTLDQIDVAWNCIDLSCINIDTERDKIFKECDILRKLSHPNILKIGDKWYNDSNGHLIFITNIVHDGSLSKYFKNRSINLIRIKKIANQILSALSYLHTNGIIHRDLKGDNIFIEGNTGNVVIGDLGLSCNTVSARSIVGTPHFMAPELFKEQYNEMVDIWSFGMVILELVTKQIPYAECKGAFQAYQAIVSGIKPLILSSIRDNYIRYFIEICIKLNPKERPTAIELLDHPFLLGRLTDRILCHNSVKPKNEQYPEPPQSPIKRDIRPSQINADQLDDSKQLLTKNTSSRPSTRTPTPNPSTPQLNTNPSTISQEKVIVEHIEINGNIYSFTMKICSNSSSQKIMTVKFEYDNTSDKPEAVADEMVKALKLDHPFLNKIENAIIDAIQSSNAQLNHLNDIISKHNDKVNTIDELINHDDEKEEKKEDEPDKRPEGEASLTHSATPAHPVSLNRAFSREQTRLKAKQETELWLTENDLSELIPTLDKEGLTVEHLRDISDDMIKEMCVQFEWNIVTRLKLQKAIKDLKPPVTPQQQQNMLNDQYKSEQTQVLDELSRKHQIISRDMKHMKDAINELEHSAKECNNAVRQNSDQLINLIEQDRDKLLLQIKSLKDIRKTSLENALNTLNNINHCIINTQKICGQIAKNNELVPMIRLQQIKQIIHKSQEDEINNNKFNNKLINKSKYKLELNLNLQNIINSIEQSMKLQFSANKFELIYNNENIAPGSNNLNNTNIFASSSATNLLKLAAEQLQPQSQSQSHNSNLMPIQSNTNLMHSTEIRAKVIEEKKQTYNKDLIITDIKLEFNKNDFIQIMPLKKQKQKPQIQIQKQKQKSNKILHESKTTNQLMLHNINPTTSFKRRGRTQSAHSGLIQSTLPHLHQMHMPKLQSRKSKDFIMNDTVNKLKPNILNSNSVDDIYIRSSPLINNNKKNRTTKDKLNINHNNNNDKINTNTIDELLVNGYIRRQCISFDICLPKRICHKTLNFYHFEYELIKFSKKYKSADQGWRFYDGQTCIKRLKVAATEDDLADVISGTEDDLADSEHSGHLEVYQNYKWILSDIKPIINNDIILFRLWIRNPNKGLIVIGICKQRMFKSNLEHKTMVYGIGIKENKIYPIKNNNNQLQLQNNNQLLNNLSGLRECQIDMKLNTINGTLCFYIVTNDKKNIIIKEKELKIIGLPLFNNNNNNNNNHNNIHNHNHNGFVPYFNSYQNSVGCQLKIAMCPIAWYGKYRNHIFR